MSSPSDLIESIRNGRKYALFVGSGGSACRPHPDIPPGERLSNILRAKYPDRDLGSSYPEVMRRAFRGTRERRAFFEGLCAGKIPCQHHYQLAELMDRGIFTLVYTTNFDQMIEKAVFFYCATQPAVYLHDTEFGEAELSDINPKIVKLHGDFLFQALANLPRELREKLHANMRHRLLANLVDRGLVVLGYGGKDETVMSLLREAAESPRYLPYGLFWVEPGAVRPEVDDLLAHARRAGKSGSLVRKDADAFFSSTLRALGVELHRTPRFGLTGRKPNALVGAAVQFPFARHVLPGLTETSTVGDHEQACPNRGKIIGQVIEAVKRHEALWIVGTPPATEAAVARAVKQLDVRSVFYFDYNFARNLPPAQYLRMNYIAFANGRGVSLAGKSRRAVLEDLFRNKVLFVLANIGRRHREQRDGDRGAVDSDLWKEVTRIIVAHCMAGAGCVILIDAEEPPHDLLDDLRDNLISASLPPSGAAFHPGGVTLRVGGLLFTVGNGKIPALHGVGGPRLIRISGDEAAAGARSRDGSPLFAELRSLSRRELRFLSKLAIFRFGEHALAVRRLTGVEDARELLERLSRANIVERQGERYRLRDEARAVLSKRMSASPRRLLEVAMRFRRLGQEALKGIDLNWMHYFFEAENLCLRAAAARRAAALLAGWQPALEQLAKGEWAGGVQATLWDLFRLEGRGKRVISGLRPLDRHGLLRAFDLANQACATQLDELTSKGRAIVVGSLGEKYRLFDRAKGDENRGEYSEAIELYKNALRSLATGRLSKLAYHAQLSLGVCFYHQAEALDDKESLLRGKVWSEKALGTARRHGYVVEEAVALDNLCVYYLVNQAYTPALKLVKRALQTLAELPGFSRDKAVVYHNAAAANLQAGEVEIAEGYFLEAAFHYMTVGDFEGLFKLYTTLFLSSGRLPPGKPLTVRALYEAVFAIWRYAGAPHLVGQMLELNKRFFQKSLAARRPRDAARAISDLGFIMRYFDSDNRTALATERIRDFFERWGRRGVQRWILSRLSCDWWSVAELRELNKIS